MITCIVSHGRNLVYIGKKSIYMFSLFQKGLTLVLEWGFFVWNRVLLWYIIK